MRKNQTGERINYTQSDDIKKWYGLRCVSVYVKWMGIVKRIEKREVLNERTEKKIGFTVACVNEFAQQHNLSIQESFRYLFQFKGIAFIKENYEVEHTLDFGKGFYLTDMEEMSDIKIKDFGLQTTEEWAKFVMNNRNRAFTDEVNTLCNKDNKYDIVIGPVADDNMALLFRQYENEIIDFETLLKGMIYKKTSSQYSFHTEKGIRLLRKADD